VKPVDEKTPPRGGERGIVTVEDHLCTAASARRWRRRWPRLECWACAIAPGKPAELMAAHGIDAAAIVRPRAAAAEQREPRTAGLARWAMLTNSLLCRAARAAAPSTFTFTRCAFVGRARPGADRAADGAARRLCGPWRWRRRSSATHRVLAGYTRIPAAVGALALFGSVQALRSDGGEWPRASPGGSVRAGPGGWWG
jgi:hypothetical protein